MHVRDEKDGIAEAVSGEDQEEHVQRQAELKDNVESRVALSPYSPPFLKNQAVETRAGAADEPMTEKAMRDSELAKSSCPSNEIRSSTMRAKEIVLKTKINFRGATLPLMVK